MEILSQEELGARLDFRRPLHPEPEKKATIWCIPFEWGDNAKGTLITIAKAKEIAAELRAAVAEAEYQQLRRYFDDECRRNKELGNQFSDVSKEAFEAKCEVANLTAKLRARKRR